MPLDVAAAALLEEKGVVRILLPFGKVVKDFINHATYATNAVIAKHPDQSINWYCHLISIAQELEHNSSAAEQQKKEHESP